MKYCRVCGFRLQDGAIFCGECGSSVSSTTYNRQQVADPRPTDTRVVGEPGGARPPYVEQQPTQAFDPFADQPDEPVVADTSLRLKPNLPTAEVTGPAPSSLHRHVLTSSTGERIVVTRGALLGRRPQAKPGEESLQLVSLADHTRSVSKTHLEFGLDGDELWIIDRFSANGTIMVGPDGSRRDCEPGRQYRVVPGTHLIIGQHELVVD